MWQTPRLPRPIHICSQESGPRTPWLRWWLSHDIQPMPSAFYGIDLITPGSQGLLRVPQLVISAPNPTSAGGFGLPGYPTIGRVQTGYSGG